MTEAMVRSCGGGMSTPYQLPVFKVSMAPRLVIQPHLSQDELEERYRPTTDPMAHSHWQIFGGSEDLPSE
jgi:hypothetical protein